MQLHRLLHGSLSLGLPRDVALSAAYAGDTDTTRLGAGRVRTEEGYILYVFIAICILESIYVTPISLDREAGLIVCVLCVSVCLLDCAS
jgi:hypothetical protein